MRTVEHDIWPVGEIVMACFLPLRLRTLGFEDIFYGLNVTSACFYGSKIVQVVCYEITSTYEHR